MTKRKLQKSYLAILLTPYGGGSWARDATPEIAAKRVVKIFQQDWKGLFTLKKGHPIKVPVFDATDRNVAWDGNTVWDKDTKENLQRHSTETIVL